MTTVAQAAAGPAAYAALWKDEGWDRRGPGFVREARQEAARALAAQGFPSTREPEWRNTSTRALAATLFRPAAAPAREVAEAEVGPFRLPGATEMVFVDGHFVPALSRAGEPPEGLDALPLSEALRRPDDDLEAHLGRHAGDAGLVPLNTAFFQDGAFVRVAPGARVEGPVHLLHLATEPHAPTACHLRHVVVAGRASELDLVESYVGLPSPDPGLTTAVTELATGDGARVRRVKLQRENTHAHHYGHAALRPGRDATVHDTLMSVGAAWSRNEVRAALAQTGAEVALDGLFLGTGAQHADCTTWISHEVPHTTSTELYKGVLDGAAHGVFLGIVQVQADAQKTNAAQTNRNLLLSTEAQVDTTPQLEIHADDVKCSHGSTIGQLSKDALFFLRSRGLDPERARLILTQAFAHEVIGRAPPPLQPMMDQLLAQWFACRKVASLPGARA
jgi:Fe-S cluster assembly protein SufD